MASHPLDYQAFTTDDPMGAPGGDEQRIQTSPNMFGGAVAGAEKQLGGDIEKAGDTAIDIATTQAHYANEATSNQGLTNFTNDAVAIDNDYRANNGGKDAVTAQAQATAALEQKRQEYLASQPNPAAREMLDGNMRRIQSHFTEGWASYSNQENKLYQKQSATSAAAASGDLAAKFIQTPDIANQHLDESDITIGKYERSLGTPEPYVDQAMKENRGKNVSTIVQQVALGTNGAEPDPHGASLIFKANADKMDADSATKIGAWLKPHVTAADARTIGDAAIQRASADQGGAQLASTPQPNAQPPGVQRLSAAFFQQESGNRDNIGTSVDNAHGPGQILPATFAQYAKPGESIDNPADNRAVQQRILADYNQRYNGDPARVAVAYFSGPGNVAPPGSPTPWITDRADGNGKTTSSYVGDIQRRLGQPETAISGAAATKANAYRMIMADNTIPQEVKEGALRYVNQQYATAQIEAEADAKARKDLSDGAAHQYLGLIGGDQPLQPDIIQKITSDPRLSWETAHTLMDIAQKESGETTAGATKKYGSGYFNALTDVAQGKITDFQPLLERALPGGDLTVDGAKQLYSTMQMSRKSVSDQAVVQSKTGLMNYAKGQLSFEQDVGPIKIRDVKGEAIFNGQFVPKFEAAYDQWIKNPKNNPWDFLTQKNVDDMIQGMRPKAQMLQDRMNATGEAIPDASAQPSTAAPAPANVDTGAWQTIVNQPPPRDNGLPFSKQAWSHALTLLANDPSPGNLKAFDASQFGRGGATKAEDLIKQLKVRAAEQ